METFAFENSDLNRCEKHDQEIILFSLEEGADIRNQLLCAQCTQERQIIPSSISWQDVKQMVDKQRKQRQTKFVQGLKPIIDMIEQIQSNLDQTRQKLTSSLEELVQISSNWKQEINSLDVKGWHYNIIQELQIMNKILNKADNNSVDDPKLEELRKCNSKNFTYLKNQCKQFSLQQELLKLSEFVDSAQQLLEKDLVLSTSPEKQSFIQSEISQIKCVCPKHNKVITMINLDKGVQREQRTLCGNCQLQNVIPKENFEERWKQYQDDIQLKIEKKKENFEGTMDNIKQKVKDLNQFVETNTNQLYSLLEEKVNLIKQQVLVKQKQRPRITQQITLNVLQQYAEELSSNELNLESKESLQFDEETLKYSNQLLGKLSAINEEIINRFKDLISVNQTAIVDLGYNKISLKVTHELGQKEWCGAIAFNYEGIIMAAGCQLQIKLWQLQNGQLKFMNNTLQGHTKQICCLVFSKKENFLVSGSYDATIRCWKQQTVTEWVCTQTLKQHTDYVQSLILNAREDQLLSCSWDKSIKVWNLIQPFTFNYDYSLEKHSDCVYCISLNETETLLVSCSKDKQIIVWGQNNRKWSFKYLIAKNVNDYGKRICFIDQDIIAWQQYKKGITHIFELQGEVFVEKPELQIFLNQESEDSCLFPSLYHKQRKLLIQKYNKFVYIIRRVNNNKFIKEQQPIDSNSDYNFGALTSDAQNLVIWNDETCQFKVYKINYE